MSGREYDSLIPDDNLAVQQRPVRNSIVLPKWTIYLTIVLFLALGACFFLALFGIIKVEKNQTPAPPSPPASSYVSDFPLRPLSPWVVSGKHDRLLNFSTNEGTWMTVSYHSNNLLFDLLGDIYMIPSTGGTASLTDLNGVQFDTQPQFSPDGKFILYTSDLSGCDNIWILDIAAGIKWMVSNETFHYVNNAKWHPSQNRVIAVKWYTSTRSLGAGELWEYPIDYETNKPSNGIQIVGRSNPESNQIGPEEPIYSSDGNSIFYSKNTMDQNTWNYNKDPHKQIYAIFQYFFETKSSTLICGGPGGAFRPVPSPDGKSLAFLSRTIYNTSLVLYDFSSGNQVVVFNGLDFDQQESSASAGVYPSFSWANNTHIFIWGKGKILLVNVVTGDSEDIPFLVNVNLKLADTVRFKHSPSNVENNTFLSKAILYPAFSPSRKYITFGSVGYSVVLDTDSNTATIISNQSEFSFSPSISPVDEGIIAHSTWDDVTFGKIVVTRWDTNPMVSTTITNTKGRFINPIFSPNSNFLVWQKISGGSLSGPTYSTATGIYLAHITEDSERNIVVQNITQITDYTVTSYTFSANSESLYVFTGSYPATLQEISLSGNEIRTLATSKYATEISISPDLKWIAFVEFHSVYVAPFVWNENNPIELSSRFKTGEDITPFTVPVTENVFACSIETTATAGSFLTWSSDSQFLSWSTASELFSVNIPEYFNCKTCPIPSQSYPIEFQISVQQQFNNTPIVFDNVTIVTLEEGTDILTNAKLVVLNDKIEDLGTNITNPPNAIVYQMNGAIILPGFVDVHAHWGGWETSHFTVKQSWEYLQNLAYGVTTLHNPSSDTVTTFADKELIEAGRKIGPRITTTGTIIYGAGGPLHCDIRSVNDSLVFLKELKAFGGFSVKSYNQPCRSARQMLIEASRQLEMNIVPEGGMTPFWNLNHIIDGHTTIEHSIPIAPLYFDVIKLFAASGTAYTPTLVVNYGGIGGENFFYERTNVWEDQKLASFIDPLPVQARSMRRVKAAGDLDYHHFETVKSVKKILENGGSVQAGAHGQLQGLGFFWELQMMAQGNISTIDVIKIGSLFGARALGMDDYVGSIKKGKFADLIFYEDSNNPLNDILNFDKLYMVMKNGILFDSKTMDEIFPQNRQNPPLPPLSRPSLS